MANPNGKKVLTDQQLDLVRENIGYWLNQYRQNRTDNEKNSLADGIMIIADVLMIDDDLLESLLEECL